MKKLLFLISGYSMFGVQCSMFPLQAYEYSTIMVDTNSIIQRPYNFWLLTASSDPAFSNAVVAVAYGNVGSGGGGGGGITAGQLNTASNAAVSSAETGAQATLNLTNTALLGTISTASNAAVTTAQSTLNLTNTALLGTISTASNAAVAGAQSTLNLTNTALLGTISTASNAAVAGAQSTLNLTNTALLGTISTASNAAVAGAQSTLNLTNTSLLGLISTASNTAVSGAQSTLILTNSSEITRVTAQIGLTNTALLTTIYNASNAAASDPVALSQLPYVPQPASLSLSNLAGLNFAWYTAGSFTGIFTGCLSWTNGSTRMTIPCSTNLP
jgi:hypothetical protein